MKQEENEDRPRVATLVSSLANYSATAPAPSETADPADGAAREKPKSSPKLGTLAGVYFPCMQNIFGVILFIRMTWIIGTAGIVQAFFLVAMCCTCVSDPVVCTVPFLLPPFHSRTILSVYGLTG